MFVKRAKSRSSHVCANVKYTPGSKKPQIFQGTRALIDLQSEARSKMEWRSSN